MYEFFRIRKSAQQITNEIMATDNDNELPQTQSQSNNLDETFSQLDENTPNAWGRLANKLKKMRTVGMFDSIDFWIKFSLHFFNKQLNSLQCIFIGCQYQ